MTASFVKVPGRPDPFGDVKASDRPNPFKDGPIGVLCGGPSAEREISLLSGNAVFEALKSLGLPVELLTLSEQQKEIPDQIARAKPACAFIALHGPFGEDGTIQAWLESMGIPYTGSSPEASRYAMDKVFARRRWMAAGLPIPCWHLVNSIEAPTSIEVPTFIEAPTSIESPEMAERILRRSRFRFPLVVKPVSQGSSIGMSLVEEASQFREALKAALPYGDRILVEEYLPGPELTVGILQERPLPVIQIVPKRRFYDYTAKYTPGMTEYLVPAPLPSAVTEAVQELALKAHQALGCRSFSRVDMILVKGRGPVLLELNAIPGMTKTSLLPKAAKAAGIDFPELCLRMLSSARSSREEILARSRREEEGERIASLERK